MLNNNVIFSYEGIDYIFDFNNIVLTKDNSEFSLALDFKQKKASYLLKQINKTIVINLVINSLQLDKNKVIIRYQISEESFDFLISYVED